MKIISNFLVALLRFYSRKLTFKSKLSVFLRLIHPLVATFIETRAPISRKYVVEPGMVMPN